MKSTYDQEQLKKLADQLATAASRVVGDNPIKTAKYDLSEALDKYNKFKETHNTP